MRFRRRFAALFLGVALGCGAIGVAPAAAHQQSAIHACYDSADASELHVIGSAAACPPGETSLRWRTHDAAADHRDSTSDESTHVVVGGIDLNFASEKESDQSSHALDPTVSWLKHGLLLLALGAAAVLALCALVQALLGMVGRALRYMPWLRDRVGFPKVIEAVGPVLQIEPFEAEAIEPKIGANFAAAVQTRLGKRETGRHLFLVTGEAEASPALDALQDVPQARLLAAALLVLRGRPFKSRLLLTGSLAPAGADGAAGAVLILRRGGRVAATAAIQPTERPKSRMGAHTANDVLAVAAAGWAEHVVADETPGPPGRKVFLSSDRLSWAYFRAGAKLSRLSFPEEAADAYEQALAIDPNNVGALVDLAHLRRREEHWEGAAIMASKAITLLGEREREEDRDLGADWLRAQIVLATTYSEWAKAENDDRRHAEACDLATKAYSEARDRLETLSTRSPKRFRGRRGGSTIDLKNLLETTFVPGALLLVAANCPRRDDRPPEKDPFLSFIALPQTQREARLSELKSTVEQQFLLDPAQIDPRPLIEYVQLLAGKSPQVVYNLACHYSLAAETHSEEPTASQYLELALEYLREAVSRISAAERRGMVARVKTDPDLRKLRDTRRRELRKLDDLVPQ